MASLMAYVSIPCFQLLFPFCFRENKPSLASSPVARAIIKKYIILTSEEGRRESWTGEETWRRGHALNQIARLKFAFSVVLLRTVLGEYQSSHSANSCVACDVIIF